MTHSSIVRRIIALFALMFFLTPPLAAEAQKRGRTDGRPGSHIGAGGYDHAGFHRYSLELQFGADLTVEQADNPPLSLGGAFSVWGDDWVRVDISGHYLMAAERLVILAGPRFQTGHWPVSLSAGLKAGPMWVDRGTPYFAVSPQIGLEMLLGDKLLLGVGWAIDIPFGVPSSQPGGSQRPYMNLGFRF